MATLTPIHHGCLAPPTRSVLEGLSCFGWAEKAYLAGSAALTLYIGHRLVRGVDLMFHNLLLEGSHRRDLLRDLLEIDSACQVETARDGYLYTRMSGDVALKMYSYPYPLIDPTGLLGQLQVASPIDLGLMKLAAIISRGTRRDFADLYLLCQHYSLGSLLDRSPEKFIHVRDFPLQALKGLADLSLVDGEPLPALETEISWPEVELWLQKQVRILGRRRLGLT